MAAKGATIVASKVIHPMEHCSFNATCKNTKDYTHMKFTSDQRYVNVFPEHCSYKVEEGKVVPQKAQETPFCSVEGHKNLAFCMDPDAVGTAFDSKVAAALSEI